MIQRPIAFLCACRRLLPPLAAAAIVLGPAPALGQTAPPVAQFTLVNGLQVTLAPDHTTQVVAVTVSYGAGSRDEPDDRHGLARLFERLMLVGSARVPAGGHARVVDDIGGRLVAEVDEESSRFGQSLPSSRLSLGLWLEADRMRGLVLNDTVVAQVVSDQLAEKGYRDAENPYAAAILAAVAALVDSATCPGYAHPASGSPEGTGAIVSRDAIAFFTARYRPNNARLIVTGDFDTAQARGLVESYFSGIPKGETPSTRACQTAVPSRPRRLERTIAGSGGTGVGLYYPLPPHDHPDTPALELLDIILTRGTGARLARASAGSAPIAIATQGGIFAPRHAPGAFALFAIASPGVTTDSLEAFLAAQAAWATGDSLTAADLARAQQIYRASIAGTRERPVDIAAALHHALSFHGAPEALIAEPERVLASTLEDLRRVARAWLIPDHAITLVAAPEPRP